MNKDPFKEYLKASEPDKADKGYAWSTAIGLQAVDGLKPSKYLVDTAVRNIEGNITLKEVQRLIDSYYEEKPERADGERTEEADKVSARIAEILSENAFSFSPNEYISIHRRLFHGIYKHAGKLRDYNITKKEWVLDGATVVYGSASELKATLEYDFSQERNFNYKGLSMDEIIHHLAVFVSRLWQIHIFGEGNTRTTAVFFIKYLRMLGFSAANDIFAEHAWYFRNALVRANYTNLTKGIYETTEYLELFLRNLLLNERNELHNRDMHISGLLVREKVDIQSLLTTKTGAFTRKTKNLKTIYMIGGPMGVGKTTVSQIMKVKLDNSVFLDGDWCWDAHPFHVTEETKRMVLDNICFLLNQFIRCSAYQNIIFCWVLHEQEILDTLLAKLDKVDCSIKVISLLCSESELKARLMKDVAAGKRTSDVVERSIERLSHYGALHTEKINTDGKSPMEIADEVINIQEKRL